jgi:hypothetical protein
MTATPNDTSLGVRPRVLGTVVTTEFVVLIGRAWRART